MVVALRYSWGAIPTGGLAPARHRRRPMEDQPQLNVFADAAERDLERGLDVVMEADGDGGGKATGDFAGYTIPTTWEWV